MALSNGLRVLQELLRTRASRPARSPDSGDDYLIALAKKEGAALVQATSICFSSQGRFRCSHPLSFSIFSRARLKSEDFIHALSLAGAGTGLDGPLARLWTPTAGQEARDPNNSSLPPSHAGPKYTSP